MSPDFLPTPDPGNIRTTEMEAVVSNDSDSNELAEALQGEQTRPGERPPLFGALRGFTRVPLGVDLTEPADPDWGKVYESGPDEVKPNLRFNDPLAE
jgi:hypothetical protein